jgi:glycosyltransferase involved in cell wall biosynthesis
MKISIITVCYNSAATLEKTILSVAGQTYKNIEFIIVDGNSEDSTLKIIKKHEDKIDKWVSEPDRGLYDAMNKGLYMATGEIIGILNSDDTFFSHTVLAEIAALHTDNSIDASVGNIIQRNVEGKLIRCYSSKDWTPEKLRIGLMPPHPSIFFKRELFGAFGFYDTRFLIGADYELIIRFFLTKRINWKYSGIITTSMLIGGLSSSGMSSYNIITKEIQKGLKMNGVKFSPFKIKIRFIWKIFDYLYIYLNRSFASVQ